MVVKKLIEYIKTFRPSYAAFMEMPRGIPVQITEARPTFGDVVRDLQNPGNHLSGADRITLRLIYFGVLPGPPIPIDDYRFRC
jgi:hypothetical protein